MSAIDAQMEWTLLPKAWSPRPVKFYLSRVEWGQVLKLSGSAGYTPNAGNGYYGYTKKEVRLLAGALTRGLGMVTDPLFAECVEGLVEFLTTHAADGLTMAYGWKHLSRAG